MRTQEFDHNPVLFGEAISALKATILQRTSERSESTNRPFIAIDCTFGRGGHSAAFLKVMSEHTESFQLIALDQDVDAISSDQAKQLQQKYPGAFSLHHCKFSQLHLVVQSYMLDQKVDYIFADIGVSSPQLDAPERGFGFGSDTLDMRMDKNLNLTAADILNQWSPEELTKIFFEYGEEPKSRIFAHKICEAREKTPFTRPDQLAEIAKNIWSRSKSRVHPGTRVFQALRIAVNNELGELSMLLDAGPEMLAPKGRMGVISFHSLEDKRVKKQFRKLSGSRTPAQDNLFGQLPIKEQTLQANAEHRFEVLKPFPQKPSENELSENPRSRSARLRWLQRLP